MALSFLAHSAQAVPQITSSLAPPKPAPAPDPELSKPKLTRGGIRDSIRLTKGRQPTLTARHERCMPPEEIEPVPTFPAHIESEIPVSIPTHQREPSDDPAQPPRIRRFNSRNQGRTQGRPNPGAHHARKRSNTGSHAPPPLSFRGFSPPEGSAQGSIRSPEEASFDTAGSHMYGQSQVSNNMAWGMNTADSQHTSDNSTRPSGNFFEAIGTVRMEAFINPLTSKFDDQPSEEDAWRRTARRQSKDRRRRQSRSRRRESLNSRSNRERQGTDAYKADVDEDCSRDDPFKGF
ncbi:hypothetical protein GGS21DRAFT_525498 [Xylaria nigripes]|nr:hypothetical protein GGS21DRAFT_525498 [Xylaria nigripes]